MKRYTSSELRSRLAEILDTAERGEAVIVERRGTRFTISAEPRPEPAKRRRVSVIEWMDPAVAEGQWTWESSPRGLRFKDRRRKKR